MDFALVERRRHHFSSGAFFKEINHNHRALDQIDGVERDHPLCF